MTSQTSNQPLNRTPARPSTLLPRQVQSTSSPKRRRLHLNPPLHAADPSSIVVADMQNESDALHILALASGAGERRALVETRTHRVVHPGQSKTPTGLEGFALIKLGITDSEQVRNLADTFFKYHHHLFVSKPLVFTEFSP
jgi:hypothetical protein